MQTTELSIKKTHMAANWSALLCYYTEFWCQSDLKLSCNSRNAALPLVYAGGTGQRACI